LDKRSEGLILHLRSEGLILHLRSEGLILHLRSEGLILHLRSEGLILHLRSEGLILHLQDSRPVLRAADSGQIPSTDSHTDGVGDYYTGNQSRILRSESVLEIPQYTGLSSIQAARSWLKIKLKRGNYWSSKLLKSLAIDLGTSNV
jgi:hypothetical protein